MQMSRFQAPPVLIKACQHPSTDCHSMISTHTCYKRELMVHLIHMESITKPKMRPYSLRWSDSRKARRKHVKKYWPYKISFASHALFRDFVRQ